MWLEAAYLVPSLAAVGVAVAGWRGVRRWRSVWRAPARLVALSLAMVAVGPLAIGGYLVACRFRPSPPPVVEPLFRGVVYEREVREAPRPVVLHWVTVDLRDRGVRLRVTPPDRIGDPLPLDARRTTTALQEMAGQLAINAGYFMPFDAGVPWSFYPRERDPVTVIGLHAADGVRYQSQRRGVPLHVLEDGRIHIGELDRLPHHTVSGLHHLIHAGLITSDAANDTPYPRTAAGLRDDGATLLILVVDGKQPGYSEGVTLAELASLLHEKGATEAIGLDGGGSSTLAVRRDGERASLLNSPCHTALLGRERPVASHLVIDAEPVSAHHATR